MNSMESGNGDGIPAFSRLYRILCGKSLHKILLVLMPAVFYSTALDRYFVCEDFGMMRFFSERPWLEAVVNQLRGTNAKLEAYFDKICQDVRTHLG